MGKVVVIYSLKPESPEVDLELIKKRVQDIKGFDTFEEKPFMFGMSQVFATFILPDAGGTDKLEEKLKSIAGVSSIAQEAFTLA